MTTPLPDKMTIGEKYDPAMAITDQAEADAYFEQLVEHSMRFGKSREEAEKIERANLGYYAGYGFDRARVERLFRCSHPIFGSVETGLPSAKEAYLNGQSVGRSELR